MKSKLYILPPLKSLEGNISSNIYRAMHNHRRIIGENHQLDFIPSYAYDLLTIEEIYRKYEKGSAYPEDSVYLVASESSQSIQAFDVVKSYKRYENLISDIKKLEGYKTFYHSHRLELYNQILKERVGYLFDITSNIVPVLSMEYKESYSLDSKHIESMGKDNQWLEDIILFFKYVTEKNIMVDEGKIDYDSFIFQKNGRLAAFIDYNSLIICDDCDDSKLVVVQNLRAFSKLLYEFYSYYYYHVNKNPPILNYNSPFSRIYQKIQNESQFSSFIEVLQLFKGEHEVVKSTERIGVFLDVANIYTDLKNMQIDYHKLFLTIYSVEHLRNIKDKYAFFFEPVYKSKKKTDEAREKQQELIAFLRKQGFEIDTSSNEKEKAKQMIDGKERDEDDYKLIQRMEERFNQVTSILLLSGDRGYQEILDKYQKSGKKVKVISTHPDSTSIDLIVNFDHSYITDYYNCILL